MKGKPSPSTETSLYGTDSVPSSSHFEDRFIDGPVFDGPVFDGPGSRGNRLGWMD